MRPIIAILLACLLSAAPPAAGENISLRDLLQRFQQAGYAIIYSTALVDESDIVDWDGRLASASLLAILEKQNLALVKVGIRRYAIREPPPESERSSIDMPPIELEPIEQVIVTASRYQLQGEGVTSSYVMGADEINDIPSFGGDTLRIVHRLPGAASIGVTSKPNVRGGNDDELLVLFDGVELVEPFHLRDFQSMFSSFNPQTIQSIEFFTGGFPARYGNKLSGVLDIATEDAYEAPGGEIGISAYNLSALYFNEKGDNRWLVSARRGNLDLVIRSQHGDPKYHDFYGRFVRELPGGRIKASAFLFDDDIVFKSDESRASSDVRNRYVWVEWQRDRKGFESRTILSFGRVDSLREGQTFAEDDTEGFLVDEQSLRIASLRHLHAWEINESLSLDFGGTYRHLSMDYDTRVSVEKDEVAAFLGQDTEIDHDIHTSPDGNSTSLFATLRYDISESLTTELGLRWDRQTYGFSDSQLSPRMSLIYSMTDKWDVRASYGRFHQPQGIYELRTTDGESTFARPQEAAHYILATEYRFDNQSRVVAELFLKKMDRLKPRYVNLFDPYVFLPEMHQDRITILADRAEAKGLELSYTGGNETFEWNVNYTWSQVRDRDHGRWVDRRWDQKHNINLFFNWYLGNWTFGTAASWHTGWATTELPASLPGDQTLDIPAWRNNDRLKDYGSLDVKISYEQELPNSSLQYFLEITNIVNRANKGGVDYEIALEDNEFLLEEFDVEPVFPLVTNIGIIWRF